MFEIRNILQRWYHENKRNLPWRQTQEAYRIWVSEIMLQQTQVAQVLPYYHRFMEEFPTVNALASASEQQVLKLWQGLGYYSRARNLHAAAKQVIEEHNGVFPSQYEKLLLLKGIGDYTAAAVSSFSAGELRACIDGNVIRVITRLFDIVTPYDTGEGKTVIRSLAEELLDKTDSATHNQAIMEFGALQCTPKNPKCEHCPLREMCKAYATHHVFLLPIKSKKTKTQDLFLYYFVFRQGENLLIRQRKDSGIWKNMYEFPLIESREKWHKQELLKYIENNFHLLPESEISFSKTYKHILSHRHVQATFIQIKTVCLPSLSGTKKVTSKSFLTYPVSRLVELFWSSL